MTVPLPAEKARASNPTSPGCLTSRRISVRARGSRRFCGLGFSQGPCFYLFPLWGWERVCGSHNRPLRILKWGKPEAQSLLYMQPSPDETPAPCFFRGGKRKKYVFLHFIKLRKMALNSFCSPAIIIYFQTLLQGTAPFSYPALPFLINEPSLQ